MKIAKLLSMTPALAACLALAVVSVALVSCARSVKRELGAVSLREDGTNKQSVKVFLEKNGVLRLGADRVEKLYLEDGSVYIPGKSSDPMDIKIGEDGKIWVGRAQVTRVGLEKDKGFGRDWGAECVCYGRPIGGPPPPPPPISIKKTTPVTKGN